MEYTVRDTAGGREAVIASGYSGAHVKQLAFSTDLDRATVRVVVVPLGVGLVDTFEFEAGDFWRMMGELRPEAETIGVLEAMGLLADEKVKTGLWRAAAGAWHEMALAREGQLRRAEEIFQLVKEAGSYSSGYETLVLEYLRQMLRANTARPDKD